MSPGDPAHDDGPVIEIELGCPLGLAFDPEYPEGFYACACTGACQAKVRVRQRFALFHALARDLAFLGQERKLGVSHAD
jgi:hypothetical protein